MQSILVRSVARRPEIRLRCRVPGSPDPRITAFLVAACFLFDAAVRPARAEGPPGELADAAADPGSPEPVADPPGADEPAAEGDAGPGVDRFGIEETTVTASPVARTVADLAQPVAILEGRDLEVGTQPTLGDTLGTRPGVSSSYYGPGASRPVVRGLDGDRVRILQNGVNTIDASATSADHALSIEPMNVERVDVVRGPATLMYGSAAVGGIVDVQDGRIPDERSERLLGGRLRTSGSSVDDSPAGALRLDGGRGDLAWQLNGFARQADDLSIPGYARTRALRENDPLPPGEKEPYGTLPNSSILTYGGGGALSWLFDGGHVGAGPSYYRTRYGTVAEPDVTIDLEVTRIDVGHAWDSPVRWLEQVATKFAWSDYEHTEFEGDEIGTVFRNHGYDGRVSATHVPIGRLEGALGFETQGQRLDVAGEEAYLPPTNTYVNSGFVFEELPLDPVRLQFAARLDAQSISAAAAERFGPADSLDFLAPSGSLGIVGRPAEDWDLSLSVSFTERAPNGQELFANGAHLATGTYEIGDRDLGLESALGIDLTLRRKAGRLTGSITGFYNRFDDFITLYPTGLVDPESDLPVYVYRAVPATLAGFEAQTDLALFESGGQRLHLEWQADWVWSENRENGQSLPRMPPLRIGAGLVYSLDAFTARADVLRVTPQHRNPQNQTYTPGYTMLNLDFTWDLPGSLGLPVGSSLFLRATNLLDETARDSVSFLKDIAPLPGIGVAGGITVTF